MACQRSPTAPTAPSGPFSATGGTYFVAINEPGADNERCDGLAPVDRGDGQCPFRDFSSGRLLHLLDSARGVRVEVRTGVYAIPGGLVVNGAGSSEAERVVLAAYNGESPVLDGRNVPRELLQVSGRFVTIQGLVLQNSGGYNLEVRGGQGVVIVGNRFLANAASDSLKGDGGSSDVVVRGNEFTQWDSQAIDLTAVSRWTIEGNRFFAPRAADANAIGVKLGSRDVTIVGNDFSATRGLSLGGTSSPHANQYEAFGISALRNSFTNVPGFAVTVYSCAGCRLQGNEIDGAGGGMRLVGPASMGAGGCAGGCRPSRDVSASSNRFRSLSGSQEGPPDVFWAVEASETEGFTPSGNTYCQAGTASGRFWYSGALVDFGTWARTVPADATSTMALRGEGPCVGW